MDAWRAVCALTGADDHCGAYVRHYAAQGAAEKAAPPQNADLTLQQAVLRGLVHEAAEKARALLETTEPLAIIDRELIPALDAVGAGFEAKKLFLPQLLMSADAAKAAFRRIESPLSAAGGTQTAKGRVLLATVKGGRSRHWKKHREDPAGKLRFRRAGPGDATRRRS